MNICIYNNLHNNLAIEGVFATKFSITPRSKLKFDYGEEVLIFLEDLNQVVDYEVGAVRAQGLVIYT